MAAMTDLEASKLSGTSKGPTKIAKGVKIKRIPAKGITK